MQKTNKTICLNSKENGKQPSVADRVYDTNGIAVAITSGWMQNIAEPRIGAMRGRNPDNPNERKRSNGRYKQRLEMNEQGISNTLTSVYKDNVVVEPKVQQVGNMYPDTEEFKNRTSGRIYDSKGLSPTLRTVSGGNNEPKIIDDTFPGREERVYEDSAPSLRAERSGFKVAEPTDEPLRVPQPTSKGYVECEVGRIFDGSYASSTTRRGRVQDGGKISPALTSEGEPLNRWEGGYRIRKLTPRECFRLMDVDEHNIDKIQDYVDAESGKSISNSQQYKMAGNSIVVNCMYHIFRTLFCETENPDLQLTIFDVL